MSRKRNKKEKTNRELGLGKKIKYILDTFISKGFFAQVLLLIGAAIVLTLLFGIVATLMGEKNYVEGYWTSLMHMIDQGVITADESQKDSFYLFMLGVTFVGMAFTSTIIAIINSAVQGKLDELKKGHAAIIEKNHVVVIGFNGNTGTICNEIFESAVKSNERICLVLTDDIPKETMEHVVKESRGGMGGLLEKQEINKKKSKKPKIMIRSGNPISENTFSVCAVEKAKAVVINRENDLETIRSLLALVSYLKKNHAYISDDEMPTVVALIHEKDNLSAAKAATGINFGNTACVKEKNEHKVRILNSKKMLGRLLAQACVHPGLPYVMDGLFNSRGASIYIEKRTGSTESDGAQFLGKNLNEISSMVTGAIPLGFARKEEKKTDILLNPSENMRYEARDRLVYLSRMAELNYGETENVEPVGVIATQDRNEEKSLRHFLILGWNEALPDMLKNVGRYCMPGSSATIVAEGERQQCETTVSCNYISCMNPHDWNAVKQIIEKNSFWLDGGDVRRLSNIVILSREGADKTFYDERAMILLLNLRQYLKDMQLSDISVVSEMHFPQNQALLQKNSSKDFVVASEISYRMMTQILDNPRKYYIIEDLLKSENDVIKLNPLDDYVDTKNDFNFECIFRVSSTRKTENGSTEIPLGWICVGDADNGTEGSETLVLSPSNAEKEEIYHGGCYDNYRLVVLSRGYSFVS